MSDVEFVSVSREVPASADVVFALLADPVKHSEIDGSGMVKSATSSGAITGVGDTFTMLMHNDEMGDYEIINHVVEYESGRRLAWEPALLRSGRAEDETEVGVRAGHRWCYTIEPLGSGAAAVTESYDCSKAPAWLQTAVKGGKRWQESMESSLDNLYRLCSTGGG